MSAAGLRPKEARNASGRGSALAAFKLNASATTMAASGEFLKGLCQVVGNGLHCWDAGSHGHVDQSASKTGWLSQESAIEGVNEFWS